MKDDHENRAMGKETIEHIIGKDGRPVCGRRGKIVSAIRVSKSLCMVCLKSYRKIALDVVQGRIDRLSKDIGIYLVLIPEDQRERETNLLFETMKIKVRRFVEGEK